MVRLVILGRNRAHYDVTVMWLRIPTGYHAWEDTDQKYEMREVNGVKNYTNPIMLKINGLWNKKYITGENVSNAIYGFMGILDSMQVGQAKMWHVMWIF